MEERFEKDLKMAFIDCVNGVHNLIENVGEYARELSKNINGIITLESFNLSYNISVVQEDFRTLKVRIIKYRLKKGEADLKSEYMGATYPIIIQFLGSEVFIFAKEYNSRYINNYEEVGSYKQRYYGDFVSESLSETIDRVKELLIEYISYKYSVEN